MANQYYTPSPFVNFNYEPNPSEGQRIVDTMKTIKKEKQVDDEIAQKAKAAEQAYTTGTFNLRVAQMKMDEVEKDLVLDKGAEQAYNAIRASGGTEAEGAFAGIQHIEQNGGWERGQKARADYAAMTADVLNTAKAIPTAANFEKAAELVNMGKPENQKMTGAELKKAMVEKKLVHMGAGNFLQQDENGDMKPVNMNTAEMNAKAAIDLKRDEQTMANQNAQIAISRGNLELNRRIHADKIATDATAKEEKDVAKKQDQLRNSRYKEAITGQKFLNTVKTRQAFSKEDLATAVLRSLNPNVAIPDEPSDEKSKLAAGLVDKALSQYENKVNILVNTDEQGALLAQGMLSDLEELRILRSQLPAAAGNIPAPATDAPGVVKPTSGSKIQDFMKRKAGTGSMEPGRATQRSVGNLGRR